MKKKIGRIIVALFLTAIILAVTVETAETSWPTDLDDQNWNFEKAREWGDFARVAELIIGLNKGGDNIYTTLNHLITVNGGKIVKTISARKEILAIVAEMPFDSIPIFVEKAKTAGARYIEPNLIVRVQVESLPNDPYWSFQWGPKKIEADWAWNATFGDHSVLVAVIDSGIDYNHPDLAANYVELGYDWMNLDQDPMDDWNHGTHIAGIIAAEINNGIGIAGLAQVKIMAEKVFNSTALCYLSDLVNAIYHATDQGAQIISMSWSVEENYPTLYSAVEYAYDSNVLLVAAAGNQKSDAKRYPAAYDEVIAVAATDSNDNPAWFSNFGDWIELAAPGVNIYSTLRDGYYGNWSGTSFACPYVSGLAALTWCEFPNETRDWIRTRLRETADDLGNPGFDNYYGYGRINARKAMSVTNYTLAITTTAGGITNSLPGNYTYFQGHRVCVQAAPEIGYILDHWELDGANAGSVNPISVLMDSNHTLHAVFSLSYTLTILSSTGGTTDPTPGIYAYVNGTYASVTAIPDTHYLLDYWLIDGNNVGSSNPTSVLMTDNHALQPVFVLRNYTLTITATAGGTTDPSPEVYTYTAGSSIKVTAIPNPNYTLDCWKLDNISIGIANPLSLTIEANHTLNAVFRLSVSDIAVTKIILSKTIVGQGFSTGISVTVANQGDYAEIFNVTVYANTTTIQTEIVTVGSGVYTTITFTWDTTGFAKGNYIISAYAWPVPDETDTTDNTFFDGWIIITIPGDINGDAKVKLVDLVILAKAYNSRPGNSNWNPTADLDNNGVVNLSDLVMLAKHYGEENP